jgi:hypothetical protein
MAAHITCMEEMRNPHKILIRKPDWKIPPEDLGIDEKIILKWICKKQSMMVCSGFILLRIGTNGRTL